MKMTDKMLIDALNRRYDKECAQYAEQTFDFSPEFERCMEQMFDGQFVLPRVRVRPHWRKMLLAAALAVAVIFAAIFTVSGIRKPFVHFVTEIYDQCLIMIYGDEKNENVPEAIESYAYPAWVPQGYLPETDTRGSNLHTLTFTDAEENVICFKQYTIDLPNRLIKSEGTEFAEAQVNEKPAILYDTGRGRAVAWNDGIYGYEIYGFIEDADLLHIAESAEYSAPDSEQTDF
ncbi:MAG: DUF4367 domain-containing protein [Oscillospiraceae bacterium]|jgi:hypothetical protein|nr:DUF4367 domain-containing protein [Oscillospiraceae bacterium]